VTPDFAFTAGQADAIRAPLLGAGFALASVAEFIDAAAAEVRDWQARWPPLDAEALRANKTRLEELKEHLYGTQAAIRKMSEATKLPLWIKLQDRANLEAQRHLLNRDAVPRKLGEFPVCLLEPPRENMQEAWHRTGRMMEFLLSDLQTAVDHQLTAIWHYNGRTNARKIPLVEGLAWCFAETFRKSPTVTPGSPFMDAAAAIGDAIGERIGKHAVADGVAQWRAQRDNWMLRT
jgi:hypothetical protein